VNNFTIRDATTSDIPALAQIQLIGWQQSYQGLIDQDWLDAQNETDYAEKWQSWLGSEGWQTLLGFDQDGKPAGFIGFGKLKTPPPGSSPIRPLYSAEVYALYVLPHMWRQGLGSALLAAAAERLSALKHHSLCLWTLEKNRRGIAFYTARGGQRCGKKDIEIGPTKTREICFGWRDLGGLRAAAKV